MINCVIEMFIFLHDDLKIYALTQISIYFLRNDPVKYTQ